MVWDYRGEQLHSAESAGDIVVSLDIVEALEGSDRAGIGVAGLRTQADAQTQIDLRGQGRLHRPPYYDNIGYADLSDFFYVWLRRSLKPVFPTSSPRSPCPRPRSWSPRRIATAARRRPRRSSSTA